MEKILNNTIKYKKELSHVDITTPICNNGLVVQYIEKKDLLSNEKKEKRKIPLGKQDKSISNFENSNLNVKKENLLTSLGDSNKYLSSRISNYDSSLKDNKVYDSYTWNNIKVTRDVFLDKNKEMIKYYDDKLKNNVAYIDKLNRIKSPGFIKMNDICHLIAVDELRVYEDHLSKLMLEWEQLKSNYIYFNLNKTQNMMDYTPSKYDANKKKHIEQCIFFLNHQIKIMRKDYENY